MAGLVLVSTTTDLQCYNTPVFSWSILFIYLGNYNDIIVNVKTLLLMCLNSGSAESQRHKCFVVFVGNLFLYCDKARPTGPNRLV